MIGILVQLFLSWLLLRYLASARISVLGFRPDGFRLRIFLLLFLVSATIAAGDYLLKMGIAQQRWTVAHPLQLSVIASGIWWNLKSALFEELIFRGALLYILMMRLGARPAIWISAAAFGIYHWFSFGVFGSPLPMLYTLLSTGLMGAVYAFAYTRTRTLYAPLAIHLGWNLVRSVVFSDTIIGRQLFVEVKPAPEVQVGYLAYGVLIFGAMVAEILVHFLIIRRQPQQYGPEAISVTAARPSPTVADI